MFPLDLRTAYLINGMLYVILPVIAWVVLSGQRTRQVAYWCGGGIVIGVGLEMFALRGMIPDAMSYGVANFLIVAGGFCKIHSLRLDLGIPWATRFMWMGTGGYYLLIEGVRVGVGSDLLRFNLASAGTMAAMFLIFLMAWRIGRAEQSRNAMFVALVYFLVFATGVSLIATVNLGGGDTQVFRNDLTAKLFALTVILSSVIGHIGYVGMALDRATRRELEGAILRARDEERHRLGAQIAHLDRQRSLGELAASLGHELNQPLASILTNIQVARRGLLAGRFDNERVVELLDKVALSTRRASRIIDRIRGYIRMSEARAETVDLPQLVREVAMLVENEAQKAGVRFVFAANDSPVQVRGDAIELSQVVLNAFRNAIEALQHAERREITVSCSAAEGKAVLRIRDTGPGLTAEALVQAGAPFFTTKAGGMGLGMSISRSIATQHGGALTIANGDPAAGGGAIVELTLPALPLSPQ